MTNRQDEIESGELKGVSWRERSRRWFVTIGTALALLATIIGFLSDSVGVLEFFSSRFAPSAVVLEDFAAPGAVERLALVSPSPEVMTTPAATAAGDATPTPAPSPTSTPLPVVAGPNERLLVVAQFTNFTVDANYNVAGRIHEALSEQVQAAQLEDTRVAVWPDAVESNASANEVLTLTQAVMVIWGEYDSGRVRVRFTVAEGGAEMDWQRLLGAPTELSTIINLDVPRETQALALMTLGRLYRNAGDMVRARAAFAHALAQEPSDDDTVATVTFYLAILDAAATPPAVDQAIAGYSRVIELQPEWLNARYNRGLAYLTLYWSNAETEHVDAAIADFGATLAAKPDYVEAYINRAIAYYARNSEGDMDAALADLNEAIRFAPDSYRAFYNRGLVYIRLDQADAWMADLEKALSLAPNFWPIHHGFCWGYALDQQPEAGLPFCDEAVAHDPSGSTRDGRGLILAQMDRREEAAADLEEYLTWLDTQPAVWSTLNNRHIYEDVLAGLRAGEVHITAEMLDELR